MFRRISWALLVTILSCAAPAARAQIACQLCAKTPEAAAAAPAKALHIDIDTALDFSTAAHGDSGAGSIEIDPRTGQRRFTGGLVGLGGMALKGVVRISGTPFRHVSIGLPSRITMHSTMGASAEISQFVADVSPDPVIGADGTLVFSFGAKLTVMGGAAGDFHASVPITAEYQ